MINCKKFVVLYIVCMCLCVCTCVHVLVCARVCMCACMRDMTPFLSLKTISRWPFQVFGWANDLDYNFEVLWKNYEINFMDINGHKKVIQAIPYYNEQTSQLWRKNNRLVHSALLSYSQNRLLRELTREKMFYLTPTRTTGQGLYINHHFT